MEILVLFFSRYGNTYALAKSVAEGIREVEGMEPRLRRAKENAPWEVIQANEGWLKWHEKITSEVPEVTLDDLVETEGLALGSPTRYGNIAPAMGNFLETTGPLWINGSLLGKVAGVFCSTSSIHGGNELTLITMMSPLIHLGYMIVPLNYSDPGVMETDRGGTPYGPTSVSGPNADQGPTETELKLARVFGKRLAEITKKVRSE